MGSSPLPATWSRSMRPRGRDPTPIAGKDRALPCGRSSTNRSQLCHVRLSEQKGRCRICIRIGSDAGTSTAAFPHHGGPLAHIRHGDEGRTCLVIHAEDDRPCLRRDEANSRARRSASSAVCDRRGGRPSRRTWGVTWSATFRRRRISRYRCRQVHVDLDRVAPWWRARHPLTGKDRFADARG